MGWTDANGQPAEPLSPGHFQPLLALVSCEVVSGQFEFALPVAAAVELVYDFTLVHSDVQAGRVDADERPSIWWVWGPAQAINAGDGLHALGRAAIMRLQNQNIPADRVLEAAVTLDQSCLRMCEGQYLDLSFQDQLKVSTQEYFDMIERKAGGLTGCAASLGALAGGADETTRASFAQFGVKLGMSWQISRDLADMWGSAGDGVTPNNLLNKKKSLPLLYALEQSSNAVQRELSTIYMKRVLEPSDVTRVLEILQEAEARTYAEAQAQILSQEALACVPGSGVSAATQAKLQSLARWASLGQV